MKEDQEDFAYDNLDKGSNKSFSSTNKDDDQVKVDLLGSLNMDKLIQNLGRPSLGTGDGSNEQRRSVNKAGGNIFAGKVRNNAGGSSGEKPNRSSG